VIQGTTRNRQTREFPGGRPGERQGGRPGECPGGRSCRKGLLPVLLAVWLTAALSSLASLPAFADEYAFILSTDFWSTSYYSTIGIRPPRTADIAVEPVSTDPVAHYDIDEDMVFVVNRYLADNVQVVDPGPPFQTVGQYSVGNGSNPYDIRLASSEKAYVSRYEWTTLLIVDPYSGDSLGVVDLSAFADADGIPEMGRMEMVGDSLFVALNNIDRTVWQPAGPGKIAVIDTRADTLVDCDPASSGVQPIVLQLPNPYTELRYDGCRMELVVGCAGAWGVLDGGIETVDPFALETKTVVATEAGLGGDISDASFAPGARWYAVVLDTAPWPDNFARLVAFDRDTGQPLDTLYNQTSGDGASLGGIELNNQQELYLCDRDVIDPSVSIFDTRADTLLARIGVGVPPFDIAFLQVPQAGVDAEPGQPGTAPGEILPLTRIIPNPFRSSTRIAFSLDGPSRTVRLDVYDASGRRVTTLLDRAMPAGSHAINWDGTDSLGRPVADGVYFYHLRSGDGPAGGSPAGESSIRSSFAGGSSTGRMVLLK